MIQLFAVTAPPGGGLVQAMLSAFACVAISGGFWVLKKHFKLASGPSSLAGLAAHMTGDPKLISAHTGNSSLARDAKSALRNHPAAKGTRYAARPFAKSLARKRSEAKKSVEKQTATEKEAIGAGKPVFKTKNGERSSLPTGNRRTLAAERAQRLWGRGAEATKQNGGIPAGKAKRLATTSFAPDSAAAMNKLNSAARTEDRTVLSGLSSGARSSRIEGALDGKFNQARSALTGSSDVTFGTPAMQLEARQSAATLYGNVPMATGFGLPSIPVVTAGSSFPAGLNPVGASFPGFFLPDRVKGALSQVYVEQGASAYSAAMFSVLDQVGGWDYETGHFVDALSLSGLDITDPTDRGRVLSAIESGSVLEGVNFGASSHVELGLAAAHAGADYARAVEAAGAAAMQEQETRLWSSMSAIESDASQLLEHISPTFVAEDVFAPLERLASQAEVVAMTPPTAVNFDEIHEAFAVARAEAMDAVHYGVSQLTSAVDMVASLDCPLLEGSAPGEVDSAVEEILAEARRQEESLHTLVAYAAAEFNSANHAFVADAATNLRSRIEDDAETLRVELNQRLNDLAALKKNSAPKPLAGRSRSRINLADLAAGA